MAQTTNSDGYFYDPAILSSSADKYVGASVKIDTVIQHPPGAVDAGASSKKVGDALDKLIRLAAAGSLSARDTGGKIHASHGSYGDVEDLNKDRFKVHDDDYH